MSEPIVRRGPGEPRADGESAVPPFHPLDYPGPVVRSAVISHGVEQVGENAAGVIVAGVAGPDDIPGLLRGLGAPPLRQRVPMLAVGSNASPRVLVHKLRSAAASTVVVLLPCEVAGMRVGHSAHVSARGYIAAAPFASDGARADVMLAMVTAEQVCALDRTEPNYRRVRLDTDAHLVTVDGEAVAGAWVYESLWGVLAHRGEPTPVQEQRQLHRTLAQRDEVFAGHVRGLRPQETVERLSLPRVREQLRLRWRSPRWSRSADLRTA